MQTWEAELKDNATQILDMIFNDSLHSGHWSKVQFGTKQKFLQRNNTTLSLVILTWLRQLQQFFLDKTQIRMGTGTFLENIVVQPYPSEEYCTIGKPQLLQIFHTKQSDTNYLS